jgi:hypothetical protein
MQWLLYLLIVSPDYHELVLGRPEAVGVDVHCDMNCFAIAVCWGVHGHGHALTCARKRVRLQVALVSLFIGSCLCGCCNDLG